MRRILAALDATPRAKLVLQTALDLARQYNAPVVLFRAVDVPPEFPPAAATHVRDTLGAKLVDDARKELLDLATISKSLGIVASVEVVSASDPWRAIIHTAEAAGADAIVVGSHGYHAIDRLLGTTAARVADRAQCLVIVVHEPPAPKAVASGPYRKIS
jgi:nucleotide-binding universal stress UspA family protein